MRSNLALCYRTRPCRASFSFTARPALTAAAPDLILFLPLDAQARNALHGAGGLLTFMDDADNVPLLSWRLAPCVSEPATMSLSLPLVAADLLAHSVLSSRQDVF